LSRLEVEEAAGIPVRQGVSRLTNGNLTSCWFAGERPGQVAILVRRFPTPAWTSEQLERMNRAVPFGTYREVAGIGDRAFLYNIQKTGGVLCVFAADYYLQVSLFRRNEEPRIAGLLQKLAASALTQLRAAAKSASSAAN
jgi:hypothetical protein